jgi:hypothetical protein
MAKGKKAQAKPAKPAKPLKAEKPGIKEAKASVKKPEKKSEVKAGKAKSEAKTETAGIKGATKKSAEKKAAGSVGVKVPNPKEVRELNQKLKNALKPVPPSGSRFGTAKTAYSPNKEVVTSTLEGRKKS